jgi:hypothetical protein
MTIRLTLFEVSAEVAGRTLIATRKRHNQIERRIMFNIIHRQAALLGKVPSGRRALGHRKWSA